MNTVKVQYQILRDWNSILDRSRSLFSVLVSLFRSWFRYIGLGLSIGLDVGLSVGIVLGLGLVLGHVLVLILGLGIGLGLGLGLIFIYSLVSLVYFWSRTISKASGIFESETKRDRYQDQNRYPIVPILDLENQRWISPLSSLLSVLNSVLGL